MEKNLIILNANVWFSAWTEILKETGFVSYVHVDNHLKRNTRLYRATKVPEIMPLKDFAGFLSN